MLLSPQLQQTGRKLGKENPSRDIPHRARSSNVEPTCPAPDGGRRQRENRTPCRRIHRALRLALAGHQILGVLPFQCVASRAEAEGEDFLKALLPRL
jgi:hypothetical protein